MKEILYIVTKANFGGAQKYVLDLATHLYQDPAWHASVAMGANEFAGKNVFKDKLKAAGIPTHDIDAMGRDIKFIGEIKSFLAIFKLIRQTRPDVLHLNSPKAAGLGALAGRLLFVKKIVYTVHGLSFFEERSALQKLLIKFFTWITFFLAHEVIIISQREMDAVADWPLVGSKCYLIHNGVDEFELLDRQTARAELASQYKLEIRDDHLLIGSIAELTANKGLSYLITALPELTKQVSQPVMWINAGIGDQAGFLERQAKNLGITSTVQLLGFVPDARRYLRAFDIFVLPSVKEGLPFCILEAGVAGLPVVATPVGGVPEVITDGQSGLLVPAGDPEALTAALEKLAKDPELRQQYGHELQKVVGEKFDNGQMLGYTMQLYTT